MTTPFNFLDLRAWEKGELTVEQVEARPFWAKRKSMFFKVFGGFREDEDGNMDVVSTRWGGC